MALGQEIAAMPYAVMNPEHDVLLPFGLAAGAGDIFRLEIIANALQEAVLDIGKDHTLWCGMTVLRSGVVRRRHTDHLQKV